ncbi:PREDICTED: uncharacterized protein LOC104781581 [Camelina sativa]|uniref:Uncharacterized protein LOC104781581 n=1 Tax=Camelina sativa TaxID=90675 RepID=A0ABM0YQX8_CAMSA|nr:PREDICTED: uncharacterized protein LOC104781581 [Camelina sativa]XP_010504598.1 PREDICTED: uncharacterized protein LOC104781581 [Camelina sativa]
MVELRSRTQLNSQLHYIRAIKGGSIKIVMNTDGRRKPKLRFRQLVDIYNLENSKVDELVPTVVRDLENISDITQGLFGAEVNKKADSEDFSMITLEKIRNRRDVETASNVQVKKEYLTQDEGCDIEEPLSSWDTKFSKKRKRIQERKAKCVSTASPSVEKVVDLPVFFHVKSEAWDDSYSVSEAMELNPADPLLDCSKESGSYTNTVLVEEIMLDSSRDMRLVPCCIAEANVSGMVAIEDPVTIKPVEEAFEDASDEFNDTRKAQCCLAFEDKQIVLYSSASEEEMELDVAQDSESENIGCVQSLISSYESSDCEEEVEEDEENNYLKPNVDMSVTGLEIVKIEAPEILAIDYPGSPIINFGVENAEIEWETEDISKDDFPEATVILQLTNYCNSLENLQVVPDENTIAIEEEYLPERSQQSLYSKHQDEAGDYKLSPLYKEPDEVQKVAETESIQQQQPHHQPEKLLSGRKALSPTSQAKLRKAMEHPDSPEKRSKKSIGKLFFSSQNSHRILKAQGLDNIDRVEIIPSSKQAIQKANNTTRQTKYQKTTQKFPRRVAQAAKAQPFSTGCTSIQGCSQKAIDFSQGQMRDFQCVAARLTKELKSMRKVTKRCLLGESNTSNISDCNLDEVRTLIGNAEKTEEGCKKWMSMIERDCKRFCKLMGMVKEESPATENIVQKKKKIRFADDAGGDLCQVKVFEIDLEYES